MINPVDVDGICFEKAEIQKAQTLRTEIEVVKKAMRNKIARHEISQIRKGKDVASIID